MEEKTPDSKVPDLNKKASHKNPFEADPFNPVRGEESLWLAVITQALMDAASKSQKPELLYHRNEARHWLLNGSSDFCTVCQLAGIDPDYTRRMAKRALARDCKWRNAPGEGRKRTTKKERTQHKPPFEPEAENASICEIIHIHRYVVSV